MNDANVYDEAIMFQSPSLTSVQCVRVIVAIIVSPYSSFNTYFV